MQQKKMAEQFDFWVFSQLALYQWSVYEVNNDEDEKLSNVTQGDFLKVVTLKVPYYWLVSKFISHFTNSLHTFYLCGPSLDSYT